MAQTRRSRRHHRCVRISGRVGFSPSSWQQAPFRQALLILSTGAAKLWPRLNRRGGHLVRSLLLARPLTVGRDVSFPANANAPAARHTGAARHRRRERLRGLHLRCVGRHASAVWRQHPAGSWPRRVNWRSTCGISRWTPTSGCGHSGTGSTLPTGPGLRGCRAGCAGAVGPGCADRRLAATGPGAGLAPLASALEGAFADFAAIPPTATA